MEPIIIISKFIVAFATGPTTFHRCTIYRKVLLTLFYFPYAASAHAYMPCDTNLVGTAQALQHRITPPEKSLGAAGPNTQLYYIMCMDKAQKLITQTMPIVTINIL